MISKIKNSTYTKHIMILMSGTMLAQLIMLILMPIITRLYTTKDFGEFSFYTTIIGTISLIISLKYESAIMLPRQNKNSLALAQLSFLIMIVFVTIISFIMLTFENIILTIFPLLETFYWLIPIGIIISGTYSIYASLSNRRQYYKKLAISKVVGSSITGVYQVGNAWIGFFSHGLIYGKLIGDFLSIIILWKQNLNLNLNLFNIFHYQYIRLKHNAKKYINFPKYQAFQVFINSLSQGLPIILLSMLFSLEVAGLYTLASRALQVPITLIAGSTRRVFYQKASQLYANNESFLSLYQKTTYSMFLLFIIPFITILITGPYLFSFIFGENWEESGIIAQILIFWTLFSFINAPSTTSYQILGLQKYLLIIEIISLILRVSGIYIGFILFKSYLLSITFFVIISTFTNIFIIYFIHKKIKKSCYVL